VSRPEVAGRKTRQRAKAKNKSLPSSTEIAPAAYSIREFCTAHRISLDHYYKQQRLGLGPTVMRVGHRSLISFESAGEWRRAREEASKPVAA
jgi:hypothetical protein